MRRIAMLVVVGLLAACASEGEPESSGDGGEPSEDTTTTEEEEEHDLEADQELAEGAVLTINDMPEGFEEDPQDEGDEADEGDDEFDQALADCLGVTVAELDDDDEPHASSPDFVNARDDEASSEVVVYATEEEAAEEIALFQDPASQQCVVDGFNDLMAADEEVGLWRGHVGRPRGRGDRRGCRWVRAHDPLRRGGRRAWPVRGPRAHPAGPGGHLDELHGIGHRRSTRRSAPSSP